MGAMDATDHGRQAESLGRIARRARPFECHFGAAAIPSAIDPGNRPQPRFRQMFLLYVRKNDDRDASGTREAAKGYN
jgi:hypothetical protein